MSTPDLSDDEPSDLSEDEPVSKARGHNRGKKTPRRKRQQYKPKNKRAVTPGGNPPRRAGSRMSGNGNHPRNRSSSRTGSYVG